MRINIDNTTQAILKKFIDILLDTESAVWSNTLIAELNRYKSYQRLECLFILITFSCE